VALLDVAVSGVANPVRHILHEQEARTAEAHMPRRGKRISGRTLQHEVPDRDGLDQRLVQFATRTSELKTPDAVLNALNEATSRSSPLHVLGVGRFPPKIGDWKSLKLGESVFVHKDVPRGWWNDYSTYGQHAYDPGIMMARISLAPYTWTESHRMIEPVGVDRWAMDLALKHGIRDGFTCPIGRRWVLAYWSRKVLSDILSPEARALVFMASSFAVMRIEALVGPDPTRFSARAQLTPRECAVLRMVAAGRDLKAIATALELGEETIRTHLRKAKTKLGARNRTQAIAEAIRQQIIP
jgi:LuxR family quorum sensing-dependent transcriptional regulator